MAIEASLTGGAAAIVPEINQVADSINILSVPLVTFGQMHVTGGNVCMLLGIAYASWGFLKSWKKG